MQYRYGHVSVTNGSQTVTGAETEFLENVSPGDLFTIVGSGITYEVASVDADDELTLSSDYVDASQTGLEYVIARDFTPALHLPYLNKGDIETATILKKQAELLDQLVNFDTDIDDPQENDVLTYLDDKWTNAPITTVGTIVEGTWNGSVIGTTYGGTGLSTTPTNGQLLIGNGSGYTLATLTAGTGINVTNGSGSITVTNSGVTSITGTANQVVASASTGAITLSLPQSIATSSTPTFAQITISNSPSNSTDTATKGYVDSVANGLRVKEPVRATVNTNKNVSNPGGSTFDSITLSSGNRLLLTGQSTASQNGIWIFNGPSSALTRPDDFTGASTSWAGSCVFVSEGSTFGNTFWVLTTDNPITIGTTSQVWSQFGGPGTYLAGTGLSLSGNTFSLQTPVTAANGGTGVNNGSSTITLAGNLVTSGANSLTLTTTGTTNVTLPTSGTLVNSAVTTLSSLVSVGTISTGIWNATTIGTNKGGTGLTSYTTGDIIYASATNTLAKLSAGAEGSALFMTSGVPAWNVAAGLATFANPINTVGLSAVNGSAITAMRSDAAPALDQSIAPTWTGEHTFDEQTFFNGDVTISGYSSLGWIGTLGVEISGSNPGFSLAGDGQLYVVGYNSSSNIVTIWDDTAGATRFSITDSTGLVTIYNNAKVSGNLYTSLNNAVAAAGTTQGAATAISKDVNVITSATGGSATGVRFDTSYVNSSTESARVVVVNATAVDCKVYPASGGAIDSLGTNVGFTLPAGSRVMFISTSTTQWFTLNGVML